MIDGVTILRYTRDQADFYAVVGPYFGSREVARALGMPMYDDPDRIWFVAHAADTVRAVAVGVASVAIHGYTARLKSAYVLPAYRGRGIYQELMRERLAHLANTGVWTVLSTATAMSVSTHVRFDFREVGRRGKYYLMRKEVS